MEEVSPQKDWDSWLMTGCFPTQERGEDPEWQPGAVHRPHNGDEGHYPRHNAMDTVMSYIQKWEFQPRQC